jgi:hypothetical protein
MNFYEILEKLEKARVEVGYDFIRKETVFECATQIYVKQMEMKGENYNDKR